MISALNVYENVHRVIPRAEAKNDILHGWKFDWSEIQRQDYEIIELFTKADNHLQGRIAYKRKDGYLYVGYAENAPRNVGKNGVYEGVGGNLFAIVCKKSRDAGYAGYVSFQSKKDDKVIANYIEKMHAKQVGNSQLMVIDEAAADYLIDQYGLEEKDE